jgi:hypothetical protein
MSKTFGGSRQGNEKPGSFIRSTFARHTTRDVVIIQPAIVAAVEPHIVAVIENENEDFDKDDLGDPLIVAEYAVEIFEYLLGLERSTIPDSNYMTDQNELTWTMRTTLVDWLIEVHDHFQLLPETLYLAINILDRFLSVSSVSLAEFQLVGITTLFIASKYEEVVCPSVNSLIHLAFNSCTKIDMFATERNVLQVLKFDLRYPNPMNFLRRISKAEDYKLVSLTKYLMEVTLLDESFISIAPSKIAAGGAYLARKILCQEELWVNIYLLL